MEPGADRTHGQGHRRRNPPAGRTYLLRSRAQGHHISATRAGRAPSYGEDCYLTARIGEAYVRGTGSGDLSQSRHALSTLKHFIAYGASEGGQNGGSNLLGERELRETYLPPFEAAVKAGALR